MYNYKARISEKDIKCSVLGPPGGGQRTIQRHVSVLRNIFFRRTPTHPTIAI